MRRALFPYLFASLVLGSNGVALAQPPNGDARGEMLYSKYCGDCHRSEIHWRDRRLVTDWNSLYAQVRHWQKKVGRRWDPQDTPAIARYLNENFYHFAPGDDIGK